MIPTSAYDRIRAESAGFLLRGDVDIDGVLAGGMPDRRLGLSLVIPLRRGRGRYARLVRSFEDAEPDQYYYPFGDLHVTVFDFLRAREGYARDAGLESRLADVAGPALEGLADFRIEWRGVVFSRGAGLICGHDGGRLLEIRRRIRRSLAELGLPNDERYRSETAHATFCRFAAPPRDPARLVRLIEGARALSLGAEEPLRAELVEHDWYNTAARRRVIRRYGPA